jgi:hypothetical protein
MGIWSEATQDLVCGFPSFASRHVSASAPYTRASPRVAGGGEICCGYQLAEGHPASSPRGADVSSSARRGVVIYGNDANWHRYQDLPYDVGMPQGVDRDPCWVYAGSGRRSLKQLRMISLFPEIPTRLGQQRRVGSLVLDRSSQSSDELGWNRHRAPLNVLLPTPLRELGIISRGSGRSA